MTEEGVWPRWSALVMTGSPDLVRCNALLRWRGV